MEPLSMSRSRWLRLRVQRKRVEGSVVTCSRVKMKEGKPPLKAGESVTNKNLMRCAVSATSFQSQHQP